MAILKHKGYKSANYFSCQQYYLYEHDEVTHKPILDKNGNMIPREHLLTAAQNTTWDSWVTDCWKVNNKYNQNQTHGEVKTHEYIISFDQRDGDENGLTLEKALEIGKDFAAKNFPGHQTIIAAHMPSDGNYDVHICINSTRMYDEEKQDFMKKSCEYEAGKKHSSNKKMVRHLKQETMDICRANGLYQIDLLPERNTRPDKITDAEYNVAVRGQAKLDAENAERTANGKPVRVTKFDTQKEELRQAIKETASYSTDFEDFKRNLHQDFGIEVTESRGKIGYIHPDRNGPIRARQLGADYEKEAIEEQIRERKGEPNKNLTPEERKADFASKYGAWSTWKENDYPIAEKLQFPEKEINKYVLENSRELHTAIKGVAEDKEMPEYSESTGQYVKQLDQSADMVKENNRPSAEQKELRQNYINTINDAGTDLAVRIIAAQNLQAMNVDERHRKDYQTRAQEIYGRDTRRYDIRSSFDRATNSPGKVYLYDEYGRKRSTAELVVILTAVTFKKPGQNEEIDYHQKSEQQNRPIRAGKNWELQNMADAIAYARKHEVDVNNMHDKIKEYGRALGNARKEVEKAEQKVEEMRGTANAAKDYIESVAYIRKYKGLSRKAQEEHFDENQEKLETFYHSAAILQKRGIITEEEVHKFVKDYKEALNELKDAKKISAKCKQEYIEVCRVRDNVVKINERNGVYLEDGFDKQQNRTTGRTQGERDGDSKSNTGYNIGRDGKSGERTDEQSISEASRNERAEKERTGKQSAQGSIDRVQSEIRGIERKVAKTAFGNRTEQPEPKPVDRPKTQQPAVDKQPVRTNTKSRTRKPGR